MLLIATLFVSSLLYLIHTTASLPVLTTHPPRYLLVQRSGRDSLFDHVVDACDRDGDGHLDRSEFECAGQILSEYLHTTTPHSHSLGSPAPTPIKRSAATPIPTPIKRSAMDLAMMQVYNICDQDTDGIFSHGELQCVQRVLVILFT